jgi:hypothetical protein
MQQAVGAMVTCGAPPAADAQRWADQSMHAMLLRLSVRTRDVRPELKSVP